VAASAATLGALVLVCVLFNLLRLGSLGDPLPPTAGIVVGIAVAFYAAAACYALTLPCLLAIDRARAATL
jgi:hypothetical protein